MLSFERKKKLLPHSTQSSRSTKTNAPPCRQATATGLSASPLTTSRPSFICDRPVRYVCQHRRQSPTRRYLLSVGYCWAAGSKKKKEKRGRRFAAGWTRLETLGSATSLVFESSVRHRRCWFKGRHLEAGGIAAVPSPTPGERSMAPTFHWHNIRVGRWVARYIQRGTSLRGFQRRESSSNEEATARIEERFTRKKKQQIRGFEAEEHRSRDRNGSSSRPPGEFLAGKDATGVCFPGVRGVVASV